MTLNKSTRQIQCGIQIPNNNNIISPRISLQSSVHSRMLFFFFFRLSEETPHQDAGLRFSTFGRWLKCDAPETSGSRSVCHFLTPRVPGVLVLIHSEIRNTKGRLWLENMADPCIRHCSSQWERTKEQKTKLSLVPPSLTFGVFGSTGIFFICKSNMKNYKNSIVAG